MIIKIKQAAASMRSPLGYNFRKVDQGCAQVMCVANMPSEDEQSVRNTFEVYQRLNIRSRNVSFHMSINPGQEDTITEMQVQQLAGRMMEGLGYGNQPWVLFRHNDIDREHYHVVSIRIDETGHKINDFRENSRCMALMAGLSEEFGYSVGSQTRKEELERGVDSRRFDHSTGDVVAQMEAIFRECCSYHFTTFNQFVLIMKAHGVDVKEFTADDTRLILRGLDEQWKPCTAPIEERDTCYDMYRSYQKRAMECHSRTARLTREADRVEGIATTCLRYASSETHFRNMMARKGIEAVIYRSDEGTVRGVTYIDHTTRCAFKGSDLKGDGLEMIRQADRDWNESRSVKDAGGDEGVGHEDSLNAADIIGAMIQGKNSRSQEKDLGDDRKKRKRGRKL